MPQTQPRGPIAMLEGTSQQNVASFLEGPRKEKTPEGTLAGAAAGSPCHQPFRFFQFERTICTANAFALQVAFVFQLTQLNTVMGKAGDGIQPSSSEL